MKKQGFSIVLSALMGLLLGVSGIPSSAVLSQASTQPVEPEVSAASYASPAGSSLDLDGSGDYVSVPHAAQLNPGSAITIEAWVRRADAGRCETVVGKDFMTGYWLGFCSNAIRFYTNGAGTNEDGTVWISANKWTHIAVTFDGTTRRYYVNGAPEYENTSPGALPSNTQNLGIGADFDGSYPFQGNLAEVRIWNIARAQADIQRDMGRVIDQAETGLVAAWHLESNANDTLGTHSGTLMGNADLSGPPAPPVYHDPIPIPRVATAPTVDGICSPAEYGESGLAIHYTNPVYTFLPGWVYLAATDSDIYVCMHDLVTGLDLNPYATVYLDPDDDGGTLAQADDYAFVLSRTGATFSAQRGDGGGGYVSPGPSNVEGDAVDTEFFWMAEFRIGRNLLPAVNAVFGMQFMHHQVDSPSDDYGWPVDFDWNTPNAWPSFKIDDPTIYVPLVTRSYSG